MSQSLSLLLDSQVLKYHLEYHEELGRSHWRNTWRPGQSRDVISHQAESSAGHYHAARRIRWELISRARETIHA